MPSQLGLHGHSLWEVPCVMQMGDSHAVILTLLGVLDLPDASPKQPHTFNSVALNKFCVCPGVEKLASAAYVTMFTSLACHSLKLSFGFKKLNYLYIFSASTH